MERCPVCRARFRDEAVCYRCGADLSALLVIEAEAAALEREAVALLAAGHGSRLDERPNRCWRSTTVRWPPPRGTSPAGNWSPRKRGGSSGYCNKKHADHAAVSMAAFPSFA